MKRKLVIIFCILCLKLNAQQFLNGSFEFNHLRDCDSLTSSNAVYNSLVDSVTGIGILQYLDLFTDSCSLTTALTAEDGHDFSSLETGVADTNSTAISLWLSQSLLASNTYIISFYDRSFKDISPYYPINILIGYSDNDSTIGTQVYTSPLADTVWTKRFVFITPTYDAQYITAMGLPGSLERFIVIDNFSFDTTGLYLAIEKEQPISFSVYPNPCKEELHVQLQGYVAKAREIKIYSVLGDVVLSKKIIGTVNTSEVVLDVHELSSGVYFAVLESEGGRVVRKIIKE